MEDIKITLETLYDILRNEKKREDLQKLETTFFFDVVNYLKEKQAFLEQRTANVDIFSIGEREKLEYELRSINRILKEIYERREKKIIDIALNRSRTGSDIVDTSSMLKEEKEFYQHILSLLNEYRQGILLSLFKGEIPAISERILSAAGLLQSGVSGIIPNTNSDSDEELASFIPSSTPESKVEPKAAEPEKKDKTKIKFIRPTPSFVWKDMNVYGPYDEGEETDMFPEVAELMIRKGRAEKV